MLIVSDKVVDGVDEWSPALLVLVGDEYLEFVPGAGLLVDDALDLLEGALDGGGFFAVFVFGELVEGEVVHLLLDEHEYLVDLLDEVHLLDHLALLDLLDVHLLLDLADLALLVGLHLLVAVDLLGLAPLLAVQLQQEQLRQRLRPLLNLVIAGQLPRHELHAVLVGELQVEPLQRRLVAESGRGTRAAAGCRRSPAGSPSG